MKFVQVIELWVAHVNKVAGGAARHSRNELNNEDMRQEYAGWLWLTFPECSDSLYQHTDDVPCVVNKEDLSFTPGR